MTETDLIEGEFVLVTGLMGDKVSYIEKVVENDFQSTEKGDKTTTNPVVV